MNGETLSKEFEFGDFKESSFFIGRYTNQCTKLGLTPTWTNVYDKVTVTLENQEFEEISTREVQLANYLDALEKVHVVEAERIDESLSFAQIAAKGSIDVESNVNNQTAKTPLHLANSDQVLKLA